jgi:2-dehydropantoate 2-reductase
MKILVVGIGGVGGYFGGLLAKHYENDENVNIFFLSRGKHLSAIREKGLTIIENDGHSFVARPTFATDDALEVGKMDYIMLCTKSFDVAGALNQITPCIGEGTVIVPFLNGVETVERTRTVLPHVEVWHGMAFIVSYIKEDGIILKESNKGNLYFGTDGPPSPRMLALYETLKNAGISVILSDQISVPVWEKFIFISPSATLATYYNCPIGALLSDTEKKDVLMRLINEVCAVAAAKHVKMAPDIVDITLQKIVSLPYNSTFSLQRDYHEKAERHELELITGYVVRQSKILNISTEYYNYYYNKLKIGKTAT